MFLLEYIATKTLDEAFSGLKKLFSDRRKKLKISYKDLENSIDYHLNFVKNWSEIVSFKDLQGKKNLSTVYVDLNLYLTPRSSQLSEEEKFQIISLQEVAANQKGHVVILGQVGAGKTTSMKKLCQLCLFNEDFRKNFSFPIYLPLKELSQQSNPLYSHILQLFGILITEEEKETLTGEFLERACVSFLDKLAVVLILDGFDELENDLKSDVGEEIKALCLSLRNAAIFITSRTAEFNLDIETATTFEITPLSNVQIEEFVRNWIYKEEDVKDFLRQLAASPFKDTALRPLSLAHLCAIYERGGKKIPDKPKTVYRKIVNLLIEEWDEQRNVQRKSAFMNFSIDRKREFLSGLSFELTTKYNKTVFDKYILTNIYMDSLFERFSLPMDDLKRVTQELESHTGLFIQSSYNNFEFSHKSLQEFLCAEYIVALPEIPSDFRLLRKVPNEMAVAVSLSSRPTMYMYNLILNVLFKRKWLDVRNPELSGREDKEPVADIFVQFLEPFMSRLVIEKPDFDPSPLTAIMFLHLYTLSNVLPVKTIGDFKAIEAFRHFLSQGVAKRSLNEMLSHYDLIENARIGKKQFVKKNISLVENTSAPRYLNCPKEWLEL